MVKSVVLKNGRHGWRSKLKEEYVSFTEWLTYSDMYGLAEKLGYESAEEAWEDNPTVEGSVNPEDYHKVKD